jgi:hypothetical protein
MTITFSETPPVYSVRQTEQPVNPGYPSPMRKFYIIFILLIISTVLNLWSVILLLRSTVALTHIIRQYVT